MMRGAIVIFPLLAVFLNSCSIEKPGNRSEGKELFSDIESMNNSELKAEIERSNKEPWSAFKRDDSCAMSAIYTDLGTKSIFWIDISVPDDRSGIEEFSILRKDAHQIFGMKNIIVQLPSGNNIESTAVFNGDIMVFLNKADVVQGLLEDQNGVAFIRIAGASNDHVAKFQVNGFRDAFSQLGECIRINKK